MSIQLINLFDMNIFHCNLFNYVPPLYIRINCTYSAEQLCILYKKVLDNVGMKQDKLRGTMRLMKHTNIVASKTT